MKLKHIITGTIDVIFGANLIRSVFAAIWGMEVDYIVMAILFGHFTLRVFEMVVWWRRT